MSGLDSRISRRRGCVALLAAALLAGCAQFRPPGGQPPPTDRFEGRLAVQIDGDSDRSFSAGFELQGDADRGELRLNGPLGTGAAQARWAPSLGAELQSGGQTRYFTDLDALATEALGEPVPLAALFDWLRGRAWSARPSGSRGDGGPGFDQLGWRIDTSRQADGLLVARRLTPLPMVTVRVRLDAPPRLQ